MNAPRRWTMAEAIEEAETLCELIDAHVDDVNEQGQLFLHDVRRQAGSLHESLLRGQQRGFAHPTEAQQRALTNWGAAVRGWIHD